MSGAVQAFSSDGANAITQRSGTPSNNRDAIRQGKEKAREVMAAAGITTGSSTPSSAQILSRKRSRDGTQLPLSETRSSSNAGQDTDSARHTHDEILLDRYIQRDLMHGVAMNDQEERSRNLIKAKESAKEFHLMQHRSNRHLPPLSVFGNGYSGFGNGTTASKPQLLYSAHRPPPKSRRTVAPRLASRTDTSQQAAQHEQLIPIRLDIEMDKLRLRDTFTWNLHEKLLTPETFTLHLLEDLKLPPESIPELSRQVSGELKEQIGNYYPHITVATDDSASSGHPHTTYRDDDLRIQIKLNITIGRITLLDQFEWDINNPHNSPEAFAASMSKENALSGEFTTAIAHAIREQSQLYTKSLYLTNHPFDGRLVTDPELSSAFLPHMHGVWRPQQVQKDWMPYLYEMSELELEKTEVSMMREHRAQKRHALNRRGGPALPDLRERLRTVRSLIVHSVIPGAVETFETTGILKTRRSKKGGHRISGVGRGDGEGSEDDLDSEASGADSPGPTPMGLVPGLGAASAAAMNPTRTRGMRGAASAAQAAMRLNYGRSQTPDLPPTPQQLLLNDARSTVRRSLLHESSQADDETLIVKLKIGKARFRKWWEAFEAKRRAKEFPLAGYATPAPLLSVAPVVEKTKGRPPGNFGRGPPKEKKEKAVEKSVPVQEEEEDEVVVERRTKVTYDAQGGVATDHWPRADEEAVSLTTRHVHIRDWR